MPVLTLKQQRALNALTQTTMAAELAEKQAYDLDCDEWAHRLPAAVQHLRRLWGAARQRTADQRHLRARAQVLRAQVPTGYTYLTQCHSGLTYRAMLFQDYTLDLVMLTPGQVTPIEDEPEFDVDTHNRWATILNANVLLVPLGVSLSWTDHTCQGALLLTAEGRYLASARVHDHGHVDVWTDDGPVSLVYTRFDVPAGEEVMECQRRTVTRALAGEFRPQGQPA
ncbi:hypothetical protein [Deinococcus aquaedulcis]|uniref:hypothetical protein n=1 Tax=Deinococcus aquaedulcis TaxID=2840455 RepID=UPI001C836DF2|nr:hypothetical protein [Deinococcus aquaedulcis]